MPDYRYVAIVVCAVCGSAFGQIETTSGSHWLGGKKLSDSNRLPVSVSWTESPIRSQLNAFAKQQKRAIFVDRRVDPTIKLSFTFLDQTNDQIVWRTAETNGLGVAWVGDLLYVGPKSTTARLPFVIQAIDKRLSKLDKQVKAKWRSNRSSIRWQHATTTSEIQDWFEQNNDITFDSQFAHDVWAGADWPLLSLSQQLSLVLAGFDLSFRVEADGKTVRLEKFPEIKTANLKKRLSKSDDFDINEAKRSFKDLKIVKSGKTLSVKGPVASIASFESWMVMRANARIGESDLRTFDLNTTAKRGDILATVAQQTGRKLVLSGDASESLNERITIFLEKATIETLLNKCLEGTGLSYRLSKTQLIISAD